MDKLYIVMPAYNEEATIENVVKSWYSVLARGGSESKLVVADSGSTDSTHDILLKMKKDCPRLEILSTACKEHGPKVIALYDFAIRRNADYIFQTDSDGQTEPGEFLAFWKMRGRYEGIFGRRKVRGDGKARGLVEFVVCCLLKAYFGISVPDANAPFRLMKTETVKKYLYKMPPDYNLPNIMMTAYFVYYHERTAFKRITFKARQGGKNSVDIPRILRIGWKSLFDFRSFKKEMGRQAAEGEI